VDYANPNGGIFHGRANYRAPSGARRNNAVTGSRRGICRGPRGGRSIRQSPLYERVLRSPPRCSMLAWITRGASDRALAGATGSASRDDPLIREFLPHCFTVLEVPPAASLLSSRLIQRFLTRCRHEHARFVLERCAPPRAGANQCYLPRGGARRGRIYDAPSSETGKRAARRNHPLAMYPARRFARRMSYAIGLKYRGSIGVSARESRLSIAHRERVPQGHGERVSRWPARKSAGA
jgi:hypothetical protein